MFISPVCLDCTYRIVSLRYSESIIIQPLGVIVSKEANQTAKMNIRSQSEKADSDLFRIETYALV